MLTFIAITFIHAKYIKELKRSLTASTNYYIQLEEVALSNFDLPFR